MVQSFNPWRLKECHLLLFHYCLLFVVLNNDLIFICSRHGNDTSPTSRFFMPVDTADQWFAYCTSTMTQKYKWKLTHSVGSMQKYKSALRQHTAQLYCTKMLALLRMRPVAVKTGLKGEADLLFLGSFQWWVRLQELTCFFVPCRLVPINHCGSPVLSSEYPLCGKPFSQVMLFPPLFPIWGPTCLLLLVF